MKQYIEYRHIGDILLEATKTSDLSLLLYPLWRFHSPELLYLLDWQAFEMQKEINVYKTTLLKYDEVFDVYIF